MGECEGEGLIIIEPVNVGSKKTKFIAAGIFLAMLAGVAYAVVTTAPQVTLTPRAFTIKKYSDETAEVLGRREYASATIELSNASNRTITYSAYRRESPLTSILVETPTGWKPPRQGWVCGTGLQQWSLPSHCCITFEAIVERDKPCRVSLAYSDGRKQSRFWQRMPAWLRQRVPWGKGYATAVSGTIDLRNTVDLPVEVQARFVGSRLAPSDFRPLNKPKE